jgi:hypothetical protein
MVEESVKVSLACVCFYFKRLFINVNCCLIVIMDKALLVRPSPTAATTMRMNKQARQQQQYK